MNPQPLRWQAIGPTVNGRTLVQHTETGVYALAYSSRLLAIDQSQAAAMARELSSRNEFKPT